MGQTSRIIIKLGCLVLVLITFFLARFGYGGLPVSFGESNDMFWVGCVTTSLYMIFVPATIMAQFSLNDCPIRMEVLLTLAGSILYIIIGSKTLEFHLNKFYVSPLQMESGSTQIWNFDRNINYKSTGMIMGASAILTGIIMIIDAFFSTFWLYTTSKLFVKNAESDDDIAVTDNTEKATDVKDKFEDVNIAGILGRSR